MTLFELKLHFTFLKNRRYGVSVKETVFLYETEEC